MELPGSELAQCPVQYLHIQADVRCPSFCGKLTPSSDLDLTLTSRTLPSVHLSHLQLYLKVLFSLCPFPSSSHALLLPWAPLISSVSLQSVRLSICLHLFASHLHLSLLSAAITSQNCSHRAHQRPQQPNPTRDFQA